MFNNKKITAQMEQFNKQIELLKNENKEIKEYLKKQSYYLNDTMKITSDNFEFLASNLNIEIQQVV